MNFKDLLLQAKAGDDKALTGLWISKTAYCPCIGAKTAD